MGDKNNKEKRREVAEAVGSDAFAYTASTTVLAKGLQRDGHPFSFLLVDSARAGDVQSLLDGMPSMAIDHDQMIDAINTLTEVVADLQAQVLVLQADLAVTRREQVLVAARTSIQEWVDKLSDRGQRLKGIATTVRAKVTRNQSRSRLNADAGARESTTDAAMKIKAKLGGLTGLLTGLSGAGSSTSVEVLKTIESALARAEDELAEVHEMSLDISIGEVEGNPAAIAAARSGPSRPRRRGGRGGGGGKTVPPDQGGKSK